VLLDASLARADEARRSALAWALSIPRLRALIIDKDRRIAVHATLVVVVAALVAIAVPTLVLLATPLLLGVPHLASEARWLVVRTRVPVAMRVGLAVVALTLATLAATGLVRAECALGLGAVAVALALGLARARAGVWSAALSTLLLLAAVACVVSLPIALAVQSLLVASHGLVTIGLWVLVFRRARRFALPALSALAVAAFAVASVRGLVVTMAFLASVHYAVWLVLIPHDAARGAAPPTFRMSVAGWKRDLGVPVIAAAVAASLLIVLAAVAHGATATRDLYLVLARFHVWLELAMGAYLLGRRRGST
jgi:hypothetical protein